LAGVEGRGWTEVARVAEMQGRVSGFPGTLLWVGVLAAGLFLPQRLALATHSTFNDHSENAVWHGWQRSVSGDSYTFHAWTEHGHGSKYVSVVHDDVSHGHCGVVDNLDHVHCTATGLSLLHASGHDGPAGDRRTYNDGHGIPLHLMEAIYS
jgi:hypothetical protein